VTIDATNAATTAATRAATRAATDAATDAATAAATDAATDAATRAATYAATRAATRAATDAATDAATAAATAAARQQKTSILISATARFLILCTPNWYRLRNGGNHWSAWVSYLSFFRVVAKLPIDYSKWVHYENAAIHGGPRFMHEKFCIVADRTEFIHRDAANLPHRIDGPFCQYRDGIKLYAVHGTTVPAEWIEDRANVDPTLALTHPNIEQRRALCEILGWEKVVSKLSPTVIHEDPDPEMGKLIEVTLPDAGKCRFLRVQCGTGRTFTLPVPVEMKTAREANAWSYGLSAEQLNPEIRT
jgi:hypothetical protein